MTTWTIGEAAAKCGLSQHTLRWYERALATQRECLRLLDTKIGYYASCVAGTPQAS